MTGCRKGTGRNRSLTTTCVSSLGSLMLFNPECKEEGCPRAKGHQGLSAFCPLGFNGSATDSSFSSWATTSQATKLNAKESHIRVGGGLGLWRRMASHPPVLLCQGI